MKPTVKGTLVLLAVWAAVLAVTAFLLTPRSGDLPDEQIVAVMRPAPTPLEAFELTDQDGSPFEAGSLQGKWTFLFFGYTYCPDICPATLALLSGVTADMESDGWSRDDYQVVFVSIDPGRDDPAHIRRYLEFFGKDHVGVTGDVDALRAFANQFGAQFYRLDEEAPPGHYFMAHSSSIFLVDPEAEFVAAFSPPHDRSTIAAQFRRIVDWL